MSKMKIEIEVDPISFADMNVCISQLFKAAKGHRINIIGMQTLQDVRMQMYHKLYENLKTLEVNKLNKKEEKQ